MQEGPLPRELSVRKKPARSDSGSKAMSPSTQSTSTGVSMEELPALVSFPKSVEVSRLPIVVFDDEVEEQLSLGFGALKGRLALCRGLKQGVTAILNEDLGVGRRGGGRGDPQRAARHQGEEPGGDVERPQGLRGPALRAPPLACAKIVAERNGRRREIHEIRCETHESWWEIEENRPFSRGYLHFRGCGLVFARPGGGRFMQPSIDTMLVCRGLVDSLETSTVGRLIDVGSGSGFIGKFAGHHARGSGHVEVTLVDIDPMASSLLAAFEAKKSLSLFSGYYKQRTFNSTAPTATGRHIEWKFSSEDAVALLQRDCAYDLCRCGSGGSELFGA